MHSQSPGAKLSLTSSSDEQFVEVFHNNHWSDSGSERVWHQARVLRERTRGGLKEVFVEYRHIKAPRPDGKNPGDNDPGEKEWVVKSRVRPDPQRAGRDDSDRLLLSSLAPGSAVELYADEAWWEGYVLEHVPPREGGGKEWLRIVYKDRLDEVTQVSPRRRLDPEQERVRTAFDWRGPQRRWARREADPDFVAVQRHPNWKSMPNQPQKSPAAAASGEGQDRKRPGQARLTVSLQVPRPAREASGAAQPSRSGQGQGAAEREQRPGQRSAPESSAALGGKQGAATPRPSGSNASGRQPCQAQPRQGSSASRGRSSSKPARSGEERRSRKGGKPVELGKRSRAGAAFDEQAAAAILHQVTELPDGSPSGLPVGSKAQGRTAAAAQPSPQRPGGASPERAQSVELVCEAAGQAAGSDGPSTSGSHGCPPRSRAAKAVAPTPADDTASSGGSSRGEQRRRYSGSSSWQVQHYRSAVKSAQCRARAITLVQDRRRSANTDTRGPAVSTKRQAQPALPCGLFLAPERGVVGKMGSLLILIAQFGERSSMVCVDNLGGLSPRTVEEELHRLFSTTLHSVSVSCSQLGEPGPQQLQRWHGWACLRFPTYLEASRAILKLRKMYWRRDDTPVLRPVIAHFPRWTQYPWGSTDMRRPGDLLLPEDVYSHSAQPNHWEFDAGQEWRQLHLVGREAKAELAAQFAEELVEELVVHLAAELGQSCLHPPQESWQEAEEGSTGIGPDAHRPTCRSLWLKGAPSSAPPSMQALLSLLHDRPQPLVDGRMRPRLLCLPARVSEEQLRRSLEQFCPDNVQPLAVIPLNVVSGQPHGVALIQLENAARAHHILRNMTEGLWMMFSCPAPIEAALYQPGGPRGLQAVFDRAHQALLQRPWAPEPPGLQEAQLVELPNPERGDAFDRAAAAVRRLMEAQEQAGTLLKAMRLERELQLHQSQQAELKRLAHDLNRHNDLVELLDEHASPDPA